MARTKKTTKKRRTGPVKKRRTGPVKRRSAKRNPVKKPRPPKGTPTDLNLWVLAQTFGDRTRIPNQLEPTSVASIRRCLRAPAGPLLKVEGKELVLTKAGIEAVKDQREKRAAMGRSSSKPEPKPEPKVDYGKPPGRGWSNTGGVWGRTKHWRVPGTTANVAITEAYNPHNDPGYRHYYFIVSKRSGSGTGWKPHEERLREERAGDGALQALHDKITKGRMLPAIYDQETHRSFGKGDYVQWGKGVRYSATGKLSRGDMAKIKRTLGGKLEAVKDAPSLRIQR